MTTPAIWIGTRKPLDERGLFESPVARAITASLVLHAVALLIPGYGNLKLVETTPSNQAAGSPLQVTLQNGGDTGHVEQEMAPVTTMAAPSSATTAMRLQAPAPIPAEKTSSPTESTAGLDWKALYYYSVSEVQQRPQVRFPPQLENNLLESMPLVNGTAKMELLVERTGKVNAANILDSNLPAPYPELLQKAFKDMEYSPGLIDGHAVRTRILIEISYTDGVLSSPEVAVMQPHPSVPHVPFALPPDRHQHKQNPPLKRQ